MCLREGLRARKEVGWEKGGIREVGKGMAPGECNHPLPPYQLTPNPHTPLGYCVMGCCMDIATHFSSISTDAAQN